MEISIYNSYKKSILNITRFKGRGLKLKLNGRIYHIIQIFTEILGFKWQSGRCNYTWR